MANLSDLLLSLSSFDDDADEFSFGTLPNSARPFPVVGIHMPVRSETTNSNNEPQHSMVHVYRHAMLVRNFSSQYGDGIHTYLNFESFIENGKTSRSRNPALDKGYDSRLESSSAYLARLYVSNIHSSVDPEQLKQFFVKKGFNVRHVHLPKQNGSEIFGFVHFIDDGTAATVLSLIEADEKFILCGKELIIERPRKTIRSLLNQVKNNRSAGHANSTISGEISDVYYGNIISAKALQNFQKRKSIVYDPNEQGIIAHDLSSPSPSDRFHLNIDFASKRLSIIIDSGLDRIDLEVMRSQLSLTWNFQDLERDGIKPMLIDETLVNHPEQKRIYLLFQVGKSPQITQKIGNSPLVELWDSQTRLPGKNLIGHANVWLFRLSSNITDPACSSLFKELSDHHLIPKQYKPEQMQQLVKSTTTPQIYIDSAKLISNSLWVEKHQQQIYNFGNFLWPSFPFETKFEIMKLISQHIITAHDLVLDENVEPILKQCSMGTFLACTDVIAHMAPRWLGEPVDHEYEDENSEGDDAHEILQNRRNHNIRNNESQVDLELRTSLGNKIHVRRITHEVNVTNTPSLLNFVRHGSLGNFSRLLLHALRHLRQRKELRRDVDSNFCLIRSELCSHNRQTLLTRKIYVTPSTIVYEGPYYEEKCFVTRTFSDHHDQFLRVIFRDEDFQKLRNHQNDMNALYQHMKDILNKGVTICDRHYKFLAFSSSQLREHSCWMFAASDETITTELIRSSMGDFTGVRPVAKYAARLGQSFSTTVEGIQLNSSEFNEIPDIKGNGEKTCFTDGIGIISPSFAAELYKSVRRSDSNTIIPSAFQIRAGGYKGVLCVDVTHQTRDMNFKVLFRDSMNKFLGTVHSIDVIHTSEYPSPAYLNRQIILLLTSMNLENADETLFELQENEIRQTLALTGNSADACQSLKDLGEDFGFGCHKFLIDFLKTLKECQEPFTHRMLLSMQAFRMRELKLRAKIRVPDSWCLLGVVDETKTLQYGQVFIQLDDPDDKQSRSRIIEGAVIVTRNPCFHPGDIRSLEAVNIPILHPLKNVIVFPCQGERSHPAEMSGGDLDGDTFWISHYPKLIFPFNKDPLDHNEQNDRQAEENEASSMEIKAYKSEDVVDFFIQYMEEDNLGTIANTHLALCDRSSEGAEDPRCLKLAKMYGIAVDFAKTGVCAPKLTKDLRPEEYPHYMEKEDKKTYQSITIVGLLYDQVKGYKIDLEMNMGEEILMASTFPWQSFHVDGFEEYKNDAIAIKHEYDRDLKRLMAQYGIKNEQEVISGYILKFNSKQHAKDSKISDLKNDIGQAYCKIRQRYLQRFWKEFYEMNDDSSSDDGDDEDQRSSWSSIVQSLKWKNQFELLDFYRRKERCEDQVKQKASAWFMVTYKPWIDHFQKNDPIVRKYVGLFSFAWLVYPVLLQIYKDKS